jgi:hypothetical protein
MAEMAVCASGVRLLFVNRLPELKNAFPEALGAAAGVALVAGAALSGNLSRLSLHEYYEKITFSI